MQHVTKDNQEIKEEHGIVILSFIWCFAPLSVKPNLSYPGWFSPVLCYPFCYHFTVFLLACASVFCYLLRITFLSAEEASVHTSLRFFLLFFFFWRRLRRTSFLGIYIAPAHNHLYMVFGSEHSKPWLLLKLVFFFLWLTGQLSTNERQLLLIC